ncbi:hypothetical protein [Ureibacillus thermosphaericus]|uniref:hypothetical protein n=1 Tax=Ureibacillus thermosphaericus TaxID=51173 RepID=UPI0030C95E6E
MNYEMQMKLLEVVLEDKIRICQHNMMTRRTKALRNELKIYREILTIIGDIQKRYII